MYGLCGFWQKCGPIRENFLVPSRKNYQKYPNIQLKVFQKDDKGDIRRHQQIKFGVFVFKKLLYLRNPIAQAVREFSTDETLKENVTSPLSKHLNKQLKLVQKAITVVNPHKRKTFATIKKYCMDKPESTYVQIRLFTRISEHDKFQQLLFVRYKYDEFLFLSDVYTSLSEQVLSNQSLGNIVFFKLSLRIIF